MAAAEAMAAGRGGVSAISGATGIARSTIGRTLVELRDGARLDDSRVRRVGGGCKPLSETDASLLDNLRRLVAPATHGDPESPLLWTSKSQRKLAEGFPYKFRAERDQSTNKVTTRRLINSGYKNALPSPDEQAILKHCDSLYRFLLRATHETGIRKPSQNRKFGVARTPCRFLK